MKKNILTNLHMFDAPVDGQGGQVTQAQAVQSEPTKVSDGNNEDEKKYPSIYAIIPEIYHYFLVRMTQEEEQFLQLRISLESDTNMKKFLRLLLKEIKQKN